MNAAQDKTYFRVMKQQDGIALLTVIAVIAILSILVLEFASKSLIDLDISANFRDRTQAHYNAKAGLNFALKVLRDDETSLDSLQDAWASPQEIFIGDMVKHYRNPSEDEGKTEVEIAEEEAEIPEPVDYNLGKAYIYIVDEERKLNINRLLTVRGEPDAEYRQIFVRLLTSLEYPELHIESLLDNITDWIDADDDGSAEKTSYYDYLDNPYEPNNSLLTSIYQLLIVKDMNRFILFGDTPYPLQKSSTEEEEEDIESSYYTTESSYEEKKPVYGLCNFINTCTRGTININTATREVLMALFDDQQFLVDDIIETRIEGPFDTIEKIQTILQSFSPDYYQVKRRFINIRSQYFWVVSVGEYGNSRVKLFALLYRGARNEIKILYQRYENMSRDEDFPFPRKQQVPQTES